MKDTFAPLTQEYQTCSNNPTTAFFTQAGVSAGNVSLLSPVGVALVLLLLGLYQFCSGAHIPRTYSRAEKDASLDALAEAMLLVRDRRLDRLKQHCGQETNNVEKQSSAILADIVAVLADVAEAKEINPNLNRPEREEPVYVDWGNLKAKVVGKGYGGRNKNGSAGGGSGDDFGGTKIDENCSTQTRNMGELGGVERHGSSKSNSIIDTKNVRRRLDSNDDVVNDIELHKIYGSAHQS